MKFVFKLLKWLLIAVFSIVLVITILNFVPFSASSVTQENKFRKTDRPFIIPHGGAKDLAPENTVYSYDMLINDYDADVLEIDLSLTKDDILISHHNLDLELSPTSLLDGELIRNYTYQEIIDEIKNDDYYLARNFILPEDLGGSKPFENLAANDPVMEKMIPAVLEDIFSEVGNSVLYILEIKDAPTSQGYDENIHDFELASQILLDLVETYELEAYVVLASFSDEVITYFKEKAPHIMTNAGMDEVRNFSIFSAFHIDFFWDVKSEVLILPNKDSMSPLTGSTANLLDMIPGIFRDNIAIKDEQGQYRANLTHTQLIEDAHRKNMAVLYWTINEVDEMRVLIERGADGIITDRPDLLKVLIDEMFNE